MAGQKVTDAGSSLQDSAKMTLEIVALNRFQCLTVDSSGKSMPKYCGLSYTYILFGALCMVDFFFNFIFTVEQLMHRKLVAIEGCIIVIMLSCFGTQTFEEIVYKCRDISSI